jgi:hypothetical protein
MCHVCLVFVFLAKEAERHTEGKWFKTTLNRELAIYTLLAWSDAKYRKNHTPHRHHPALTHVHMHTHTNSIYIYIFPSLIEPIHFLKKLVTCMALI